MMQELDSEMVVYSDFCQLSSYPTTELSRQQLVLLRRKLIVKLLHSFHRDERGLETMEYVILATLVAALMTLAVVALFNTIVAKIKAINDSL
jgi:Flp pilus assembly pilin Flp